MGKLSQPQRMWVWDSFSLMEKDSHAQHPPPMSTIGKFFSSMFFFVLATLYRYYICYENMIRVQVGGYDENRPKWPTRSIIWAIGSFFFFFHISFFSFVLTTLFRLYICYANTIRVWVGSNDKNGPKWHFWCVIWAIGTFFFLFGTNYST